MKLRILAVVALLAISAAAALAAPTLYVGRGSVPYIVQQGVVYAPASDLLAAMGYGWQTCAEGYSLTRGAAAGPALKGAALTLVADGKRIPVTALWLKGQSWLPVRSLAESLGGVYLDSSAAGVLQVSFPRTTLHAEDVDAAVRQAATAPPQPRPATTPSPASTTAPSSAPTPAASPASDDKKEPYQAEVRNPVNPYLPGSQQPSEVRGTVWVKNISSTPMASVKITLLIIDQGGRVFDEQPMGDVASMAAGQEFTKEFLWYNYQNQKVTPQVKVEYAK